MTDSSGFVDASIENYLRSTGIDYEPYHFSLNQKLSHANRIKEIINGHIPLSSPNLSKESLKDLKKLKETGIVQFSEPFLKHQQLSEIHQYLKEQFAYPAHIPYYDKEHPINTPYEFKGQILSFNADTIINAPHLIEALSSQKVLDLIVNYLGVTPTLFDLNVIFNFGDDQIYHETQHYHRDHDDFHHCLLMLYLNDVDEHSGGHLYATGSHKKGFNSSSIPPTIESNESVHDVYDKQDEFVMETVTGLRGKGFISDANGIHSGSVPKLGKRRMIFWARFGLGENYMWKHHNHRYWGYSAKTFRSKIQSTIGHNTDHIFRLFAKDYDPKIAKSTYTKGDGCMRKTSKYGWNIGVYGQNYYAMRQMDGHISIEDFVDRNDSVLDAIVKLENPNILVSNDEQELIELIKTNNLYPQFSLIRQNFMGYNIAAYGKIFYGMRQMDGDLGIPEKVSRHETTKTAKRKLKDKNILVFSCLNSLLEVIEKKHCYPAASLLEEGVDDYNIIGFRGRYYALRRGHAINIEDVVTSPLKFKNRVFSARRLKALKSIKNDKFKNFTLLILYFRSLLCRLGPHNPFSRTH
ncbi:MAG: hypothetical protein CMF45_03625 [Legionellales bacterium]|nr:hypothetical protein [Legionellales bacterium]